MPLAPDALIVKLLTAISALSGYAVPEQLPKVAFVPHSYLEEQVCQRPCRVMGWFPAGETIYLDDSLDVENDTWAQGILLHELVHYLQQEEGALAEPPDCRTWEKREQEAYEVQYRWLIEQRVPAHLLRRISWPFLKIHCQETGPGAPR